MEADSIDASSSFSAAVRDAGWAVTPPVVPTDVLDAISSEIVILGDTDAGRGGLRNLLDVPGVRALARSAPVRSVAEAILGPGCFTVRGLLFDKTPGANWRVAWHQDVMIAVRDRREVEGFEPWSEKAGVIHVQPPVEVLERMLAVRVHLDECGPGDGPVRVLPGSHRAGRLGPSHIDEWKARAAPVACLARRGGILAFRPLLLHASSPAESPSHRRVVHLEFAAGRLPGGLEWRWTH
jgi:ectoine hydroxylase-related dioxygenase (phytanoyl-CoA dioxygenase family)